MFETATLSSGPATKRFWSACIGLTGETLLVACAILAPIVSPQVLPRAMFSTILVTPGPPPPRPPAGAPVVRPHTPVHTLRNLVFTEPSSIPATTPGFIDPPQIATAEYGVAGSVGSSGSDGVDGGIAVEVSRMVPVAPPPVMRAVAPPPEPKPLPAQPKRIQGGRVNPAERIFGPEPQYPQLARQMRTSGTVELVGVIGTDGHLRELRIVSGHPLLARAALDAVSQWVYKPTLLNGEPVEVIAPITVTFRLN